MTSVHVPGTASRRHRRREALTGLAFVLPMLVLFLLFRFGPFLGGVFLAFGKYTLGGGFRWTGTANFHRLVGDALFWQSLKVALIYTVVTVPLLVAVAVGMALLVRRSLPGVRFFRAVFFLPVITSLVLAGVVFIWLFNAGGALPRLLGAIGLYDGSWLTNETLAVVAIAVVAVWGRFGFDMLIVLARLQDIPRELEEAATMDGAGAWQRFRHLTLPQLRPVFFFLGVVEVIGSFQVFDVVYIMTGGGPGRSTYTLGYMLYDQAFKYFDFGYASAVAVALFVIVLVIALVQRLVLDREE
ncbi:sugar ABC transporter permease [Kribbella pittospori]|uniref:Sugar ABC transporter permease n=1 Tax=Kribbella pittospori TaxID=722689 RepID=A0A4R0L147_9ACTN|nr:sugar ABC transporter permease [Kribbella pittospori]TCC62265.1 sugar ABC transporter permease [Kribbella pittospori]